ncbi:ac66 [Lambdina fiscellaria nucleopolyhedrovirus]|uniref:Ac66 n=1 Tax=Lambdina fiscellaria nucleopolyhedrovirus TaxID=1642929 RepID=A0A0E3Z620_9ABAC|nr:ac66 [Lambdina fiscellaria nucleopolyhedrovirus]AKC91698.1 ac66 [Lambdina fiscellaria nucleopolyhedrovirus]
MSINAMLQPKYMNMDVNASTIKNLLQTINTMSRQCKKQRANNESLERIRSIIYSYRPDMKMRGVDLPVPDLVMETFALMGPHGAPNSLPNQITHNFNYKYDYNTNFGAGQAGINGGNPTTLSNDAQPPVIQPFVVDAFGAPIVPVASPMSATTTNDRNDSKLLVDKADGVSPIATATTPSGAPVNVYVNLPSSLLRDPIADRADDRVMINNNAGDRDIVNRVNRKRSGADLRKNSNKNNKYFMDVDDQNNDDNDDNNDQDDDDDNDNKKINKRKKRGDDKDDNDDKGGGNGVSSLVVFSRKENNTIKKEHDIALNQPSVQNYKRLIRVVLNVSVKHIKSDEYENSMKLISNFNTIMENLEEFIECVNSKHDLSLQWNDPRLCNVIGGMICEYTQLGRIITNDRNLTFYAFNNDNKRIALMQRVKQELISAMETYNFQQQRVKTLESRVQEFQKIVAARTTDEKVNYDQHISFALKNATDNLEESLKAQHDEQLDLMQAEHKRVLARQRQLTADAQERIDRLTTQNSQLLNQTTATNENLAKAQSETEQLTDKIQRLEQQIINLNEYQRNQNDESLQLVNQIKLTNNQQQTLEKQRIELDALRRDRTALRAALIDNDIVSPADRDDEASYAQKVLEFINKSNRQREILSEELMKRQQSSERQLKELTDRDNAVSNEALELKTQLQARNDTVEKLTTQAESLRRENERLKKDKIVEAAAKLELRSEQYEQQLNSFVVDQKNKTDYMMDRIKELTDRLEAIMGESSVHPIDVANLNSQSNNRALDELSDALKMVTHLKTKTKKVISKEVNEAMSKVVGAQNNFRKKLNDLEINQKRCNTYVRTSAVNYETLARSVALQNLPYEANEKLKKALAVVRQLEIEPAQQSNIDSSENVEENNDGVASKVNATALETAMDIEDNDVSSTTTNTRLQAQAILI